MSKKVYTLAFIRRDSDILLGLKKRGFGCGMWNGFGGKLEPNESVVDAGIRELKEECCVSVNPEDMKSVAHLEFTFDCEPIMMDVRVFCATKFEGEPQETEEMAPKWFPITKIPYDKMWPDDKIWFPYMLSDKCIYAKFNFVGYNTIASYEVEEIECMDTYYLNLK